MKAALVIAGAALVAWVSRWSFAPPPAAPATHVAQHHAQPAIAAPPAPHLDEPEIAPPVIAARPAPMPSSTADIDAAIADGHWSEDDRQLLGQTLAALPDDQKLAAIAVVSRAANAGRLALDVPIL